MGKNTTEIQATVLKQTAMSLTKMCGDTGLSVGEVIDRLTLNMRPKVKELAVPMAFQEIVMVLSALPEEENDEAFIELISTLLAMIPVEFEDDVIEKAAERRKNLHRNFDSLSSEQQEWFKDKMIEELDNLFDED